MKRYMGLARDISFFSPDPSTKCGAVIVRPDGSVAAMGHNDFPPGIDNTVPLWNDRAEKYARIIHAEMAAIMNLREPVDNGYAMYVWPPGCGPSCDRCAAHIIYKGIDEVVFVNHADGDFPERWKAQAELGLQLFRQANVTVYALPYEDFQ